MSIDFGSSERAIARELIPVNHYYCNSTTIIEEYK